MDTVSDELGRARQHVFTELTEGGRYADGTIDIRDRPERAESVAALEACRERSVGAKELPGDPATLV